MCSRSIAAFQSSATLRSRAARAVADEGPPPPHIDWTAQRVFLERAVSVWQVNLAALLAVLFVATEPRAVARWSGVLMGLGPPLAYGLGASVIPVDYRASAFGVLHSGAQIGSAVSPMLSGLLAASSLQLAFLGNAALLCGGTVVAWHWLGARQADHRSAAPPGTEGVSRCHTHHSCRGRCTHALEPDHVPLTGAGQRPAAAVEGRARRGAGPWKDLGVTTSVKATVVYLTTSL
jgi:hypothetical protein